MLSLPDLARHRELVLYPPVPLLLSLPICSPCVSIPGGLEGRELGLGTGRAGCRPPRAASGEPLPTVPGGLGAGVRQEELEIPWHGAAQRVGSPALLPRGRRAAGRSEGGWRHPQASPRPLPVAGGSGSQQVPSCEDELCSIPRPSAGQQRRWRGAWSCTFPPGITFPCQPALAGGAPPAPSACGHWGLLPSPPNAVLLSDGLRWLGGMDFNEQTWLIKISVTKELGLI